MNFAIGAYGSSGGGGNVIAFVDPDRALSIDRSPQQGLLRSMRAGSAGVVVLVKDYGLYWPHVGTSPTVFDRRGAVLVVPLPIPAATAKGARTTTRQAVLRMSSADQALEVLAALSLNKTLLADVLGVSRPTLYDWLEGKQPSATNAQRLTTLVQLLANSGVTAATPLSPRFVKQPLNDADPPLLELLEANILDVHRIDQLVKEAKALERGAEDRRVTREARLAALGFEEPSDEERKANLALNVALREWPKD